MAQTRQLVAIMFTDIVAYTALMGIDEQFAFKVLKKNRSLHKPVIKEFDGHIVKELGDGMMAYFSSVSKAVSAAIVIQKNCRKINEFQLRIGIHMGEVLLENNDIFGDGVNIASRIQSMAEPGTIFISEMVYKNISNKKDIATKFVSEAVLKNVATPLKIYQVVSKITPGSQDAALPEIDHLKTEFSIAVLPFLNLSTDPEQKYFCEGISEEIIIALTQLNNLRVVSRTSVLTIKGKNLSTRDIGKLLGVNTLLEGSVRKAGNQLRIITNLVKVGDSSHIWSNRYDRELEDIFVIQDDIAQNVGTAVRGYITTQEKNAIRRPETSIEAYTYFLKGRQFLHQLSIAESKKMFEEAIQLDSSYAPAFAGLSDLHCWLFEWNGAKIADLEAAENNSRTALTLAPDLSESHTSRAYVLSLSKNFNEAELEFKEAIKLNPNSFDAYYFYARSSFAHGEVRKSADLFLKASQVRLEDFQSLMLLGQSLDMLGANNSEEIKRRSIERAKKQLKLNPNDRRALSLGAGTLLDLGERTEGIEWINRAMDHYPEDPTVLTNAACLFAKDGNKEKALDILELAWQGGHGKKDWIENDPDYDSIREEPRFIKLFAKLK